MKTLITILLSTILAACGQGSGTGAQGGSKLGVSASDTKTIARVLQLQVASNTAVNVSFSAAGVVFGALTDELKAEGYSPTGVQKAGIYIIAYAGHSFLLDSDEGISENVTKILEVIKTDAEIAAAYRAAKTPLTEAAIAGDTARLKDEMLRAQARNMIVPAVQPNAGWPVNVMGAFKNGCWNCDAKMIEKNNKILNRYVGMIQVQTEFASQIATELASQLSTSAWRDPAAAREAALIAWHTMPVAKIRDALAAAQQVADGGKQYTVDLAGNKAIHWNGGAGDYLGDGAGWTVTRAGAPWFGGGFLSGRKIDIKLASAISSSQSKQSGDQSQTGSQSGVDAGGNAQVK